MAQKGTKTEIARNAVIITYAAKKKDLSNNIIFFPFSLFYISCSHTSPCRFAEGKSDKEILDHLLTNSRYDKRLLPPVDGKLI